jgi:hypothetical protein
MKYFTVVFKVNDEDAFRASDDWKRIHDLARSTTAPFWVSAMSHDHEVLRSSFMEDAAARYAGSELSDAIEAISQCPDLTEWSWEKFETEDA